MGASSVIRCGDALEELERLEPGSVDALITDPPYCAGAISEAHRTRAPGQGLRSERIRRFGWFPGDNMGTAGLVWLLRAVAVRATRVLRATGSLLVFADWRMIASLQPAIESSGLRFQGLVVWDKGSMGLGRGFRHQHELVLHFTAGAPEYHDAGVGDVIRCGRVRAADRVHHTQKPVELLETLVRVVTPAGGVVVDPFCGSGSTGVAALRLGRSFVGVDCDPNNCETARRRCGEPWAAAGDEQGTLFEGVS